VSASMAKSAKEAPSALVKLKVDPKSSKKAVDWVDLAVDGPVVATGLPPGRCALHLT
jgi:hypothetical protein